MILSAKITASAIIECRAGDGLVLSNWRSFLAARMAAAIKITRLRPSSISRWYHYSPFVRQLFGADSSSSLALRYSRSRCQHLQTPSPQLFPKRDVCLLLKLFEKITFRSEYCRIVEQEPNFCFAETEKNKTNTNSQTSGLLSRTLSGGLLALPKPTRHSSFACRRCPHSATPRAVEGAPGTAI